MWSVGVVLYILLGGYRPFRGDEDDVLRAIRYGEYKFHKRYWKGISDDAKILITRMLTVNPIGRITATAALSSDWFFDDSEYSSSEGEEEEEAYETLKKGAVQKVRDSIHVIRWSLLFGTQSHAFESVHRIDQG